MKATTETPLTPIPQRKRSRWFFALWGGFNAGAVFGIIDSLMVIFFGLASFDRTGQIVGFIVWDAIGFGALGSLCTLAVLAALSPFKRIKSGHRSLIILSILTTLSMILIAANVGWSFSPLTGTPPDHAPNILLITLDTLRSDATGSGGHPFVRTPTLDRLSRLGRHFINSVCPVPMTTPSHASMLTSMIPAVHGAKENRYRLGIDSVTLTEILRNNGWRTAAFVSCFPLDRRFGLNQGFMIYDDRFGAPGDLRQASWYKAWKNWREKGRMERNCRSTNSLAIPWLRKYTGDGVPFFLWVHYFDPHSPYAPPIREQHYYHRMIQRDQLEWPDEYAEENARKAVAFTKVPPDPGRPEELYLGEVSEMDRAVGELMHHLAQSVPLDDTLVVLLSDHGESFGEHGFFFTHGEDIYEPALSIWMTIYAPGQPAITGLDPRLASAVDVATTVLPFAGLPPAESMEGFDMLGPVHRHAALIENFGIVMNPRATKQRGIRTESWKMMVFPDSGYDALYALSQDPGERHNVRNDYPEFSSACISDLHAGFGAAEQRRRIAREDRSPETLEKLRALGYVMPE
ncbi:sulfatase [bacterium]|nr:sulfatase [candidate division CSSED10-310 bacterium]